MVPAKKSDAPLILGLCWAVTAACLGRADTYRCHFAGDSNLPEAEHWAMEGLPEMPQDTLVSHTLGCSTGAHCSM